MTKYKLIKEYPGCQVSIGDIVFPHNTCANLYTKSSHSFDRNEVENYPEFWEKVADVDALLEEAKKRYPKGTKFKSAITPSKYNCTSDGNIYVSKHQIEGWVLNLFSNGESIYHGGKWAKIIEKPIEKDYEILSFSQHSGTLDLWTKNKFGYSRNGKDTTPAPAEYFINNDFYSIHSIKRLSDGEIFTVGDKINGTHSVDEVSDVGPGYTIILEFYLDNNKIGFYITTGRCLSEYRPLLEIKHFKKPLFTTEDGVGVCQNDSYSWVRKDFSYNGSSIAINICYGDYPDYNLYFSTKEKAQEYIDSKRIKVEDGYIYENQESFSVCAKGTWQHNRFTVNRLNVENMCSEWKHFATEKARDKYIEENKPMYSKMDMLSYALYYEFYKKTGSFGAWLSQNKK
jgi:hypothetical protein